MTQNHNNLPRVSGMHFEPLYIRQRLLALIVMCSLVAASELLVQPQYHINQWLTFGALTLSSDLLSH